MPGRRCVDLFACAFSVALVATAMYGCRPQGGNLPAISISGPTMGTRYNIKLLPCSREITAKDLQADVDHLLAEINQQMSTYIDDSELSRFNQYEGDDWFPVSAPTAEVVHVAQQVSEQTNGAFDVTVGPLVDLWNFGPERKPTSLPGDDALDNVQAAVGHQKLEVRLDPPALKKALPELHVDLSAIAKGYAVDRVAELLDSKDIESYMVEIGGELRLRGNNDKGEAWRIAIEVPKRDERELQRVIQPGPSGMATSGDYRNFFEFEGKFYSHTIDPKTGRPVEHKLASATVLANTCMQADAWATALLVLGPDDGLDWATKNDVAALLIVREAGDKFVEIETPAFADRSMAP